MSQSMAQAMDGFLAFSSFLALYSAVLEPVGLVVGLGDAAVVRQPVKECGGHSSPAVRRLPKPKRRIRWLTKKEAERLLSELPSTRPK